MQNGGDGSIEFIERNERFMIAKKWRFCNV